MNGKRLDLRRIQIGLTLYESIETNVWFSVFEVVCVDQYTGWEIDL